MSEVRVLRLRREIAERKAELRGVENGTLLLVEEGPITSRSVAERLGVSDQVANNRLAELFRLGVIDRSPELLPSGGKRFLYKVRT
jgi:predicted transcriptional regulator